MKGRSMIARIETSKIDPETGEFPMILATDGEASDGDILSIEGARFPAQVPLQNAHGGDARDTLGSVTGMRRDLQGTPKKLRARGHIEMTGDGVGAEIRRDIAHMIGQGHIRGVSVRWNPVKWTARTALPKEHPAYVDGETEKDFRKRYGLFFEKWDVLEGSIAPVQADREAVIGRAEETEGEVSAFWRSLAEQSEPKRELPAFPDPKDFQHRDEFMREAMPIAFAEAGDSAEALEEATQRCEVAWESRGLVSVPTQEEAEKVDLDDETRAAIFAARLRELQAELGVENADLRSAVEAIAEPPKTTEQLLEEALARIAALEAEASTRDQGRVSGEPAPPSLRNAGAMVEYLITQFETINERNAGLLHAALAARMGKVTEGQNPKERMEAEARAFIEEMRSQQETPIDRDLPDMREVIDLFDRKMREADKRTRSTFRDALAVIGSQRRVDEARDALMESLRQE